MFVNDYQVFSWKKMEKQSEIICRLLYSENLLCPLPPHPRQWHEEKMWTQNAVMSCKSITFAAEKRLQTALESTSASKRKKGKVLEWLKRHAWKACIRQKRIGGSNPPLSAISLQTGKRWSPMVSRLFSLYCLCSETVPFRFCLCFR